MTMVSDLRALTPPLHSTGPLLPEDVELLVIGDVHGQATAFEALMRDLGDLPRTAERRHLVLLGDLIDRGPDSLGCIDLAMAAAELTRSDAQTTLAGNHELMLRSAIADAAEVSARGEPLRRSVAARSFLGNGGQAFVSQVLPGVTDLPVAEGLLAFRDALGDARWDFLSRMESHARFGKILCVHAGILPKKPMSLTLDLSCESHLSWDVHTRHWAWIRDKFLAWSGGWREDGARITASTPADTLVLHGHTSTSFSQSVLLDGDESDMLFQGMDRTRTHGRVCLDAGAARDFGVAGAQVTPQGEVRLALSLVEMDPDIRPNLP